MHRGFSLVCNIQKTKTYVVKKDLEISPKFRVIYELDHNVGCRKREGRQNIVKKKES